jgi:hypothetical protein
MVTGIGRWNPLWNPQWIGVHVDDGCTCGLYTK